MHTIINHEVAAGRINVQALLASNEGYLRRLVQSIVEFAGLQLDEVHPYLILDAHYEQVHKDG